MQVEVSKHTEGNKVKALRPNGLPESLIKYDGNDFFLVDNPFRSAILLLIHRFKLVKCLLHAIFSFKWYIFFLLLLSCHAARQKDRAVMEVTELVQAVRHPHPNMHSSTHQPSSVKSSIGEVARAGAAPPQNEQLHMKSADHRSLGTSKTDEGVPKRHRSSGFRSLIGYCCDAGI